MRRRRLPDDDAYDETPSRRTSHGGGGGGGGGGQEKKKGEKPALSTAVLILIGLGAIFLIVTIILFIASMVPREYPNTRSVLANPVVRTPLPWFETELQWHQDSSLERIDSHLWVDSTLFQFGVSTEGNVNSSDYGIIVKGWETNADLRLRAYAQRGLSMLGLVISFVGLPLLGLIAHSRAPVWVLTPLLIFASLFTFISWGLSHHYFATFLWSYSSYCDMVAPSDLVYVYRCTEALGTSYYLNFGALWMLSLGTLCGTLANFLAVPSVADYVRKKLEKLRGAGESSAGNGNRRGAATGGHPTRRRTARREDDYHVDTYELEEPRQVHHPIRSPARELHTQERLPPARLEPSHQRQGAQRQRGAAAPQQPASLAGSERSAVHGAGARQKPPHQRTLDLEDNDFEDVVSLGEGSEVSLSPSTNRAESQSGVRHTRFLDPKIDDWAEVEDDNVAELWYSKSANLYLDNDAGRVYDADEGTWYQVA